MVTTAKDKTSVVVAVKNGEKTLERCLSAIFRNSPFEVIVVAATESDDATVEIARGFPARVIETVGSSLSADRQCGIDEASGDLVLMVDADHILHEGAIEEMLLGIDHLDAGQAGLRCASDASFWQRAESDYWHDYHNNPPGHRRMIGTAPTLYRRQVFEAVSFSNTVVGGADDTDFVYRLCRETEFRIGVLPVVVEQLHDAGVRDYLRKFLWYGQGDWEFIVNFPRRAPAHIWHISVRHIAVRFARSAIQRRYRCAIFVLLMGIGRSAGAVMAAVGSLLHKVMHGWKSNRKELGRE